MNDLFFSVDIPEHVTIQSAANLCVVKLKSKSKSTAPTASKYIGSELVSKRSDLCVIECSGHTRFTEFGQQ